MFKGNPRKPGSLSFANVRFLLDEERMSRLRDDWKNPTQTQLPQPTFQPDSDAEDKLNDEWVVSHLASDSVTGLLHEVNVLVGLNILSVAGNGKMALSPGWERRVPHMVLNEMDDSWGSNVDVNNLYCIHDKIKSSLDRQWKRVEGEGWRLASKNDMIDDDDEELVFEDEEYQLRKHIFTENYTNWISEKSGMGEFGV